jgi:carboxyl-terminal processing protease
MKRVVTLLLAASLMAACVDRADAPSTTSPPSGGPSTTLTASIGFTPIACEDAQGDGGIVCEAYDLIREHYVDDVADAQLAAAIEDGLEPAASGTPRPTIECALPSPDFEAACAIAVETVPGDEGDVAEAMLRSMVSGALDPNSSYFDQEALALLEEEQEGEIEGIGALVSPEDQTIPGENKQCSIITTTCRILIVSTIAEAPADLAGLRRDDVIVAVDGESIRDWTIDEVTAAVRGPAGSEVVLGIERAGTVFEVTITRAAVVIPVIASEMVGDTGYIQLQLFSENADEQFESALVDLISDGADRLVVDLRDNPGGLLDTAVEITSMFLTDGDVVVTQGPEERTSYPVTGHTVVPEAMQVVFVVNKGSASASEVVSAALQERGRATVVGENTFGKNTVQQRFPLSNGGALKLTIARWLTAEGHDFGGVGVTPDVEIEIPTDIEASALVDAVLAAA